MEKKIEQLWKQYHKGRDEGDGEIYRNQLIENYMFLIYPIAKKIHSKFPPNIELDDLIQEGVFGLINAIEKFDFNQGVNFKDYAPERISGSILDGLRNLDWVPNIIISRISQTKKAKKYLESKLNRYASEKELIQELSKDKYKDNDYRKGKKKAEIILKDSKNVKKMIPFPYSKDELNEDNLLEEECIKNIKAQDPIDRLQKRDFKILLTKDLTRAERLIINLVFVNYQGYTKNTEMVRGEKGYRGASNGEIGKALGVNYTRVSQLRGPLLEKIKNELTAKGLTLEDCLNDL